MRRLLIIAAILSALVMPVSAMELEAPTVPKTAMEFMPSEPDSFSEGLLEVIRDGLLHFSPELKEAAVICGSVIAVVLITSVIGTFPGVTQRIVNLSAGVAIAALLLHTSDSLVSLAAQTVKEVSEYGKLLLPVMTAALAAQGGVSASAALYTGTALFDSLLSGLIWRLLTPMIYIYLALSAANCAIGEEVLKKLRDSMKGFMTWVLKTVLYVFTGYISITGVVSGSTDAALLKAAKLTISGAVPVVGGILSDASEAVLVSAGTLKNSVGIYGMFAILAIWMGPFLKIGAQYLTLKAAAAICSTFGSREICDLIGDFSTAMGFLLAMTSAVCLMLMISMVCFLRSAV